MGSGDVSPGLHPSWRSSVIRAEEMTMTHVPPPDLLRVDCNPVHVFGRNTVDETGSGRCGGGVPFRLPPRPLQARLRIMPMGRRASRLLIPSCLIAKIYGCTQPQLRRDSWFLEYRTLVGFVKISLAPRHGQVHGIRRGASSPSLLSLGEDDVGPFDDCMLGKRRVAEDAEAPVVTYHDRVFHNDVKRTEDFFEALGLFTVVK